MKPAQQTGQHYVLLPRQQRPRPFKTNLQLSCDEVIALFAKSPVLALDYETTGLEAHDPSLSAFMVGLSNGEYGVTLDLRTVDKTKLYNFLNTKKLVMHNAPFDSAWYFRDCGRWPNLIICTYAMFKYLATEGYPGQSWSLKTAMVELLGWEVPNNVELNQWLKQHGFKKHELWNAPYEMVAEYCAMDAVATFHLYELLAEAASRFPALIEYYQQTLLLIKLVVVQQFSGITVNLPKLKDYHASLLVRMDELKLQFFKHPDVEPYIMIYNQATLDKHMQSEPPKFTKKGDVTSRWTNWNDKIDIIKNTNYFNINSKPQLAWLFYDCLKFKITTKTEGGKPAVDKNVLPTLGPAGKILAKYAKMGKEVSYIEACLKAAERDGVIHPTMKVPGTVTGRPGGGSL